MTYADGELDSRKAQMQVLPIELGVRMEFFGTISRRDDQLLSLGPSGGWCAAGHSSLALFTTRAPTPANAGLK